MHNKQDSSFHRLIFSLQTGAILTETSLKFNEFYVAAETQPTSENTGVGKERIKKDKHNKGK